jgi:hypothetical protein
VIAGNDHDRRRFGHFEQSPIDNFLGGGRRRGGIEDVSGDHDEVGLFFAGNRGDLCQDRNVLIIS